MKKIVILSAVIIGSAAAFLAALVVLINSRGGLSPRYSGLRRAPLLGSLVKIQTTEKPDIDQALAAGTSGSEVPYLRFAPKEGLPRLARELEAKRAEYEALLRQLKRRQRELDGWERQLKVERDKLRERFSREKEQLAATRQELEMERQELEAFRIEIEEAEEANLAATASIYDRMASERAANILMEMYTGGQQETVVKIVYLMQDRTAAKTLEAFADPKIGAQITERLQRVASPQDSGGI